MYVNTEGRVQQARIAVFPPGEAREDWKVIRALSEAVERRLPYDSLKQVRARLVAVNAVFAEPGVVRPAAWPEFGGAGSIDQAPFASPIANFYMTDPISRASATMARCTETLLAPAAGRTGTDG